ncbi:GAF domain-containing protein [Burkholderiaceae bacterium DAT-1]|nr:GAF domain-containing protein [Burkholderiaceae bacterium DAT-1]
MLLLQCRAHAVPAHEQWELAGDALFHNMGPERGLPSPVVQTLAQDGRGYMWVGTQDGLARWDGYRFKVYRPDPMQQGSLPASFISVLHTDASGRLWIGTNNGGLALYDHQSDRFKTFGSGKDGLSSPSVYALAADGRDGLWIATDGGLDHLAMSTGQITHVQISGEHDASAARMAVADVWMLDNGTLLTAMRDGVWRRLPGQQQFSRLETKGKRDLKDVVRLFQDSTGQIWMGTRGRGVFVCSGADIAKAEPLQGRWHLVNEGIQDVAEPAPGEIWLATSSRGIARLDIDGNKLRMLRHEAARASSLPDNSVTALYRDRSGLVWVGTNRGLALFHSGQHGIYTLFGETSRSQVLTSRDVSSLLFTSDQYLWAGSPDNGVEILDLGGNRVSEIWPSEGGWFPQSAMTLAIAEMPGGDVFLGTTQGLFRLKKPGRRPGSGDQIRFPEHAEDVRIASLHVKDNVLWIGTLNHGLWRLALDRTGKLEHVDSERLDRSQIRAIESGVDGQLWLGTRNGLLLVDPAKHLVEPIQANPSDPEGLGSGFVSSLRTDHQGNLWVGTFGSGVQVRLPKGSGGRYRFRTFGVQQGLPNENVNAILIDAAGLVWVSTDNGLARIDPERGTVEALGEADGVAIHSYWANAGVVTPAGKLIFGGQGGLTIVNPEQIRPWVFRPPVVFTRVTLGGHDVAVPDAMGGRPANLRVAPDANSLTVEFASLDYSEPELNRYAYQLVGFDAEWIETDWLHRSASYTNLSPGHYILKVRGTNRAGAWSQAGAELHVEVLPAWYQTPLFKLAMTLVLVLGVVALIRVRTRRLRRQQVELQAQIDAKTEELREAYEALLGSHQTMVGAADTLRQIGEIGQAITASLDERSVYTMMAARIPAMLDTTTLSIYLVESGSETLYRAFGMESGKALPEIRYDIHDPALNVSRAAREQRLLLVEYPRNDFERHEPGTIHTLTALFSPLMIGQRLIGVMTIQTTSEHAYGEREQSICQALSSYIAIAIANANVYGDIERQVADRTRELQDSKDALAVSADLLRSLGEVGKDITATLDLEAVFSAIYKHVIAMLDVNTLRVVLLDESGTVLRSCFGVENGERLPDDEFAIDHPAANSARAVREGREILVDFEPGEDSPSRIPGTIAIATALFTPIKLGDRLIGVMSIQTAKRHAYGEREQSIFRALCAYAAIAIANATMYQSIERTVAERTDALRQSNEELQHSNEELAQSAQTLHLLGEIGRDIMSSLDAEAIFDAIYRHVNQLLASNVLEVYVVDDEHAYLRGVYSAEDGRRLPVRHHALDDPLRNSPRAARERRELVVDFDPAEDDPTHVPGTQNQLSAMFAPLLFGERLIGVMSVQSLRRFAYGEREQAIMRAICGYVAIALANNEAFAHLAASKVHVTSLLDNSGEGFLSIDARGVVDPECSLACETMLGCNPAGKLAAPLLFAEDLVAMDLFNDCLTKVFATADAFKRDLMLSLLPEEVCLRSRILSIRYRWIEIGHVMIVLDDVTEARELAEAVAEQQARMEMIVAAVSEPAHFRQIAGALRAFCDQGLDAAISHDAPPADMLRDVYRMVHTFKGNAGQFSMRHTVNALHALETALSDLSEGSGRLSARHIRVVVDRAGCSKALNADLDSVRSLLGEDYFEASDSPAPSYDVVKLAAQAAALSTETDPDRVRAGLAALTAEMREAMLPDIASLLQQSARSVSQTAAAIGKLVHPLEMIGETELKLDPDQYPGVFASLVHVLRNAVVHGIESPAVRAAAGKPVVGRVSCKVSHDQDWLTLELEDDGAGIDVDRLRLRYLEHTRLLGTEAGSAPSSEIDVLEMLCTDGVSTTEAADTFSGRGVGLAATRQAIEQSGGHLSVDTQAGKGTRFVVRLPIRLSPQL